MPFVESTEGNFASDATAEPIDAELARIVDAWGSLPEPIRRALLAMVDASR